jgi:hypothetical protein
MKRHSPAASLALAALVVLGLAGPADAGEQVPFKGRLEAGVTLTPLDPPFASVLVKGTGNATHLGQFAWDSTLVGNLATGEATGTYQFTAANGDMLFADFTGLGTPTATPGVLSIVDTANITGGTGRFAGATGIFTVNHLFDMTTSTTFGSFEGTISSPGAAKRSKRLDGTIASTGAAKRSKRLDRTIASTGAAKRSRR